MAVSYPSERSARISVLLEAALDMSDPDRAAFIERETANDPSLRQEMTVLLAQLGTRAHDLVRRATDSPAEIAGPALDRGTRIGVFGLLDLIGRGGMGEVYRAARLDGTVEQIVALKLLRRDAIAQMDRFSAERQILAKLEHPGIARLYDAGIAADERPYMVMELVDGVPITDWCHERKSSLLRRLNLFLQVCDAVACAHQNLVVHRDLKPANILVTRDGQVKLLDFGVAKLLSDVADESNVETPLSLPYAAPEQLTQGTVTTATDVYALGVLLFELLSGRLPWETNRLPLSISIGKLLHEVAPLVSRVRVSLPRPIPAKQVSGDLDAIVAKALRKDRSARYQTVVEMAQDVRRHFSGEPVAAREGALMYLFGRFLKRYRWAVAATAAMLLALAGSLSWTAWQAREAARERDAARAEADRYQQEIETLRKRR
jgi:eukaryotic-like serine/threonine-protein kinase